MLAKGDADVFDNLTPEEIMNPIGTVPKGGFISQKDEYLSKNEPFRKQKNL